MSNETAMGESSNLLRALKRDVTSKIAKGVFFQEPCCYLFILNLDGIHYLPKLPLTRHLDFGRYKLNVLNKSNLAVMPATLISQSAQPDDSDDMETDSDKTPTSLTLPAYRNRALTSKQERKLVAFLDDLFLQLTRNYKKRSVYCF